MPELPEVETIRNELVPHIIGRTVTGLTLCWEGIVRQSSAEEFRSRLVGQIITGLSRRGKYLIFSLSSGELLMVHLRMTGSLLLSPNPDDPERFIRAIIHLDEGDNLYFRDPRKFGVMWLARNTDDLEKKLGPEPLEDGFTLEILKERLKNRQAPIKALLLDQNLLAGVGNMYADEALFSAGIHPLRSGDSLSAKEVARLYLAIREILWAAIGNKGASVENYYRPGGELGTAHFQFRVAHKLGGDTCPVCQAPIKRIVVRNRGTYFCPKCQPRKRGKAPLKHP